MPRRFISSASKVAHMSRGSEDSFPMVTAGWWSDWAQLRRSIDYRSLRRRRCAARRMRRQIRPE